MASVSGACIDKRRARENYRKRRNTFIKKAHELALKYSADVYLVLRRDNKYHIYTSNDRDGWPPSKADLVWPL